MTRKPAVIVAHLLGVALAGCSSIGPGRVAGDRYDYSSAIGDSWKSQTLLNIVKLRYLDPPIFVDIGQIVASRSLSQNLSVNGGASGVGLNGGVGAVGVGASGTYTDSPTVTYTPLTGDKFIRSLMTPLRPEAILFMIQSGWPADAVLLATTASINGLNNQESTVAGTTLPEPAFLRALALLRKIQLGGGVAMRLHADPQKGTTAFLAFRRADIPPEVLADSMELRRLLRLAPDATDYSLTFGATAVSDRELAMQTRSIMQLMQTLAVQVHVPERDLAEHRAPPGWESAVGGDKAPRMIEVHCSKDASPDAYVSVYYRGHHFWIDDRDLTSKRAFAFMMGLFTLADTTNQPAPPQLVLPMR